MELMKNIFLYVAVTGDEHPCQERENVGMQVQFSKINIHLIHVNGNKCMEIVKKTDAWLQKEEGPQQWRLGEVKARKLWKKRDAERNRYNQMAGEEKARSCRRREILRETDAGS